MRPLTAGYIQQTNKPSGGPDDTTKKPLRLLRNAQLHRAPQTALFKLNKYSRVKRLKRSPGTTNIIHTGKWRGG